MRTARECRQEDKDSEEAARRRRRILNSLCERGLDDAAVSPFQHVYDEVKAQQARRAGGRLSLR